LILQTVGVVYLTDASVDVIGASESNILHLQSEISNNTINRGISQIYYTYSLKYQIITSTEASVKYTTPTIFQTVGVVYLTDAPVDVII
jgi:hypothetical protein